MLSDTDFLYIFFCSEKFISEASFKYVYLIIFQNIVFNILHSHALYNHPLWTQNERLYIVTCLYQISLSWHNWVESYWRWCFLPPPNRKVFERVLKRKGEFFMQRKKYKKRLFSKNAITYLSKALGSNLFYMPSQTYPEKYFTLFILDSLQMKTRQMFM